MTTLSENFIQIIKKDPRITEWCIRWRQSPPTCAIPEDENSKDVEWIHRWHFFSRDMGIWYQLEGCLSIDTLKTWRDFVDVLENRVRELVPEWDAIHDRIFSVHS